IIPNSNIVDWVLVELRTTASGTSVEKKACFLRNDGTIVGTDGSSLPCFAVPDGNYYVIIRHRNHLAIMTTSAISLSISSSLYDFTAGPSQAYGTSPTKLVGSVYAMWGSDVNANGQLKYNGSANDRNYLLSKLNNVLSGVSNGYYMEDVNM